MILDIKTKKEIKSFFNLMLARCQSSTLAKTITGMHFGIPCWFLNYL